MHPFRFLWKMTYSGMSAELHSDFLVTSQGTVPGLFVLSVVIEPIAMTTSENAPAVQDSNAPIHGIAPAWNQQAPTLRESNVQRLPEPPNLSRMSWARRNARSYGCSCWLS